MALTSFTSSPVVLTWSGRPALNSAVVVTVQVSEVQAVRLVSPPTSGSSK